MAIQIKSEEQRKLDKEAKKPKTKLEKARRIMFVITVVFSVFSLVYFFVGFNPTIVIMPVLFLWMVTVAIPTVASLGLIYTSEGYRNFAQSITNLLGSATQNLETAIKTLQIGLPYIGSITLATILAYGILNFLIFRKNKENKKNFIHLIISIVLLVLVTLFFVLAFVFYNKVLQTL